MKLDKLMHRPFSLTAIGWFLVAWNMFVIITVFPRDIYYHNMPFVVALLTRITSVVFILLGVAMLYRKNWARVSYLFFAPFILIINLIVGTIRLGEVNIIDRVPSMVVTVLLIIILLRPGVRAWFHGSSLPPQILRSSERPTLSWIKLLSIVGSVMAALIVLSWLVNHFIRVVGPGGERGLELGDDRGRGIIEYLLSK